MAAITEINLTDAKIYVGAQMKLLDGFGEEKFSCVPAADRGSLVSGVDGDTMHMIRNNRAWTLTLTLLIASPAVSVVLGLQSLGVVFPIKIEYGDWNLVGVANVINEGDVAAGLGTTTRTITLGVSKISGDTDVAPGRVVQVL